MATLNAALVTLCPTLDADALREIIDSALTDGRINNFLNFAYWTSLPLVGNLAACGGDSALCDIILLLAAHYLTMFERQAKSESVAGEWTIAYLGKDGFGLDSSLYGQNAKAMDCSGLLAKAGFKVASFSVVSYYDIQDDFDDDWWWV